MPYSLVLEGILVYLQVREHPQQALEQQNVDGVSTSLALDQQQQAIYGARLHQCVHCYVVTEQVQTHVP